MKEPDWISAPATQVASAPLWHPLEKMLYWSDAATGCLYRYSPLTNVSETVLSDGRPVGAMTLQADGSILLFRDAANVVVFRNNAIEDTIINSISDFRQTRFAAAAADPSGRIICAVFSDSRHTGRLLLLDRNGRLSLLEDGFGVPAGLAFSANGSLLFFNDSHSTHLSTWVYPYNTSLENPLASHRSLFHACFDDPPSFPGAPAGIVTTTDGSVWIARRDGAILVRHSPDGSFAEKVRIKARKPMGLCFGGDDFSNLYISTSSAHRKAVEGPHAGDLAVLRNISPGASPFVSKILLPDELPDDPPSEEIDNAPEVPDDPPSPTPPQQGFGDETPASFHPSSPSDSLPSPSTPSSPSGFISL